MAEASKCYPEDTSFRAEPGQSSAHGFSKNRLSLFAEVNWTLVVGRPGKRDRGSDSNLVGLRIQSIPLLLEGGKNKEKGLAVLFAEFC
jgi:hypothetical protein